MKFHDLSANLVKLHYPTLLETAKIATFSARTTIERALSKLQSDSIYNREKGGMQAPDAESLANAAKDLVSALYTWKALEAMKERGEVEFSDLPLTN